MKNWNDVFEKKEWYIEPEELIKSSITWHDFINNSAFVYFLIDGKNVVYVGQSVRIHSRIKQHVKDKDFDRIIWIQVPKLLLSKIENFYIQLLKPRYNKTIGNDVKSAKMIYRHAQQVGIKPEIVREFINIHGDRLKLFIRFRKDWKKKNKILIYGAMTVEDVRAWSSAA